MRPLHRATPNPTPALLQAGITEAAYDGYARQAVVWYPTGIDALGPQDLTAHNMHFAPTDAVAPETVTGVFLSTSATTGMGTLLLSCARGTRQYERAHQFHERRSSLPTALQPHLRWRLGVHLIFGVAERCSVG